MIDVPLILVGGLLGSAHCVGMCGGFVVSLGIRGESPARELCRQMIYAGGRICTYTLGGAMVGYFGARLEQLLPKATATQGWLCIAAGMMLIAQAALEAGIWRRKIDGTPCSQVSLFGSLWKAARWRGHFIAGAINGLLPCGLVYAYLALAASSGTMARGAMTMAIFGLGTAPALVALGLGSGCIGPVMRRRLVTVAASVVFVTGLMSMARGISFIQSSREIGCPMCSLIDQRAE